VTRIAPLVFALALAACAAAPPAIQQAGILPEGSAIVVRNISGDIDAFAPEHGADPDRYVVAVYDAPADAVTVERRQLVVRARARRPGARFLVRGPRGSTMDLSTDSGSIMVADFEGIANVHTGKGNVRMLLPQYGNASVGTGSISANIASDDWPGTLRFTVDAGNVELYVNEHARAQVHMHTDDGTIYSDFPLRGTSRGSSETIDQPINGGAARALDIEVRKGSIRLMQLKPQI